MGTNKYYKYRTGTLTTAEPLIPNFATAYKTYFDVGKNLSGLYTDYVEMKNLDTVGSPVDSVDIFLDGEVATKYLFNNSSLTRPEPTLTAGKTFASYDINVNGFYLYFFNLSYLLFLKICGSNWK